MSRIRTLPRKRTVQQRSITVPKIRKKRKGFRAPLAKVKIKRKNPGGGRTARHSSVGLGGVLDGITTKRIKATTQFRTRRRSSFSPQQVRSFQTWNDKRRYKRTGDAVEAIESSRWARDDWWCTVKPLPGQLWTRDLWDHLQYSVKL